jgi:hypothetical protein
LLAPVIRIVRCCFVEDIAGYEVSTGARVVQRRRSGCVIDEQR